jgi:hypothetical protein
MTIERKYVKLPSSYECYALHPIVTDRKSGCWQLGNKQSGWQLVRNPDNTCAVERRWSTAGESPARELGSLHPEAIGVAVEETKPSEPPV